MKGLIGLYLSLTFGIAIVVTLLHLMGVLDAPLGRVWAFWWIPALANLFITLLIRFGDWIDGKTHY